MMSSTSQHKVIGFWHYQIHNLIELEMISDNKQFIAATGGEGKEANKYNNGIYSHC